MISLGGPKSGFYRVTSSDSKCLSDLLREMRSRGGRLIASTPTLILSYSIINRPNSNHPEMPQGIHDGFFPDGRALGLLAVVRLGLVVVRPLDNAALLFDLGNV